MIKLLLLDIHGELSVAYIRNDLEPVLTDEFGQALLDLDSNPFYPQSYTRPKLTDHPAKAVLDSFMCRPYCPPLNVSWVSMGDAVWQVHFPPLADAMMALTGKQLLDVAVC